MTITEGLRQWLSGFDGLQGGRICVDCLPDRLGAYSLDSDPSYEVKPFLYGASMVTQTFVFSSKEAWGEDLLENEEILSWYEDFSAWVSRQNLLHRLPNLGKGRQTLSVLVTSAPFPFSIEENQTARYQITLRVQYMQPTKP